MQCSILFTYFNTLDWSMVDGWTSPFEVFQEIYVFLNYVLYLEVTWKLQPFCKRCCMRCLDLTNIIDVN